VVALLTGGWDALRKLTAEREFDFEVPIHGAANGHAPHPARKDLHGSV
jgi:hypothetical protein